MKKFKNCLNKIIKSWWFPWLLVGVVIRLVLMPITLHPDLLGHLSLGLFNPLWPQLNQAPDLSALLSRYFDVFQFKSLIRSVFAGASIFFILRLFLPRLKNEA